MTTTPRAAAVLLAVLVMALSLPASVAFACSCIEPDPNVETTDAVAVFTGTVTDAEGGGGPLGEVRYQVRVEGVEKGTVEATTVVSSPRDSASCGVELLVGQRYRIFAYAGEDAWSTNLCTATAPVDDVAGDPPSPLAVPEEAADPPGAAVPVWLVGLGVLAGVAAVAGLLYARRTRPSA